MAERLHEVRQSPDAVRLYERLAENHVSKAKQKLRDTLAICDSPTGDGMPQRYAVALRRPPIDGIGTTQIGRHGEDTKQPSCVNDARREVLPISADVLCKYAAKLIFRGRRIGDSHEKITADFIADCNHYADSAAPRVDLTLNRQPRWVSTRVAWQRSGRNSRNGSARQCNG